LGSSGSRYHPFTELAESSVSAKAGIPSETEQLYASVGRQYTKNCAENERQKVITD
jgi:hypothetical protein